MSSTFALSKDLQFASSSHQPPQTIASTIQSAHLSCFRSFLTSVALPKAFVCNTFWFVFLLPKAFRASLFPIVILLLPSLPLVGLFQHLTNLFLAILFR